MDINKNLELTKRIAREVDRLGGQTYYVGGYVRDKLLDIQSKDIDIEVYGISVDCLRNILTGIGELTEHNKSFPIFGLKGYEVDIAMPRKERLVGNTHTSFEVSVDPYMSTYEGALRRDLTINSIMQNVLTEAYTDNFNGIQDLEDGIIRCVNPTTFTEDALRVLRVAQFNARFPHMKVDTDTMKLCSTLNLTNLSKERIYEELVKALTKSPTPSKFFYVLKEMKQLSYWFTELDLDSLNFNYAMNILDSFVPYKEEFTHPKELMIAGLCIGIYRICKNWDTVSTFLKRLTNNIFVMEYVENMVKGATYIFDCFASMSMIHPLKCKYDIFSDYTILHYIDIIKYKEDCIPLLKVILTNANFMGINNNDIVDKYIEYIDIYNRRMCKPLITGKDLISLGYKPGPQFSIILQDVHDLQLQGLNKDDIIQYIKDTY